MKFLLLIFLFVNITFTFGQCPQGDVVLFNQSEVDNFATIYPNCESIEGFLIINGNDIVDLSALSQINSVGSIGIYDTSLVNMQGIEALTITGLDEEDAFIVLDNSQLLQNVMFLDNYTVDVPVVFLIRDMSSLTSLEGVGGINEFVTIYLENNDGLVNLDGFNEDINITGGFQAPFLYFSENAILSDISRLNTSQWNDSLTSIISDNSQLEVCENNLVCWLIENGAITILNNSTGCNSTSEVSMACENLSLDEIENNLFKIYPNPVSKVLFIDGLDIETLQYLRVYSSDGKKILETKALELDMSKFQSGLYFVEIATNKGKSTKLIIRE